MIQIKNIDDPRIEHYRSLKYTPESHTRDNIFIAEGDRLFKQLIRSDFEIVSIFALEKYFKQYGKAIENNNISSSSLFFADKKIMDQIVGFRLHKGIMAMARQPEEKELTALPFPMVVLNGILKSENVGAIIRNCAAFGIKSLLWDSETSSPFMRRAVRVSQGGIFYVDCRKSTNIIDDLQQLKSSGTKVISVEITNKSIPVSDFSFPESSVLVFGSEGRGISEGILNISDAVVHIPITDNIESINVAAASAVVLNRLL